MVSLPLMARLLDAVRTGARLVLVGDPYQLASIEAGTVLADVVGPVGDEGDAQGDDHADQSADRETWPTEWPSPIPAVVRPVDPAAPLPEAVLSCPTGSPCFVACTASEPTRRSPFWLRPSVPATPTAP